MTKVIEQLEQKGYDTSWYHKNKRTQQVVAAPKSCGRLSIYLLKKDNSYTVNSDGSAFRVWRPLKQPVTTPEYFCSGCKKRWLTWEEATGHL